MATLVHHFGDRDDSARTCGMCDFCSPERATAGSFREPTPDEQRAMHRILAELERHARGRSIGKLYEAIDPKDTSGRKAFDALIDGLCRAGYVSVESASFTPADGGRDIAYRKVCLNHEGHQVVAGDTLDGVQLRGTGATDTPGEPKRKTTRKKSDRSAEMKPLTAEQKLLDSALRTWRRSVAADLQQPAFCVFGDKVLRAIVTEGPANPEDLLSIHGLGRAKIDRWGKAILSALRSAAAPATATEPGIESKRLPPTSHAADHAMPPALTAEAAASNRVVPCADLDRALKIWRMHEAKRLGIAPFLLLLDQTIRSIAQIAPRSPDALRRVEGLSEGWVERHGTAVVGVVAPFLT